MGIKKIYEEFEPHKEDKNFGEWLSEHVRIRERLIKIIGKIKWT